MHILFDDFIAETKLDVAVMFHSDIQTKIQYLEKYLKPFLKNLVMESELEEGRLRVALGYFGKRFRLVGGLLQFKSKANYSTAIDGLSKKVRSKSIHGRIVLKKMRAKIFRRKAGDRSSASDVVIFLTDSNDNEKPADFSAEAESLKQDGFKIITIGINTDEQQLSAAATKGGNSFFIKRYADLSNSSLLDQLRHAMFKR